MTPYDNNKQDRRPSMAVDAQDRKRIEELRRRNRMVEFGYESLLQARYTFPQRGGRAE